MKICPQCRREMVLNRFNDRDGLWCCEHCGQTEKWRPSQVDEHTADPVAGKGLVLGIGQGR